ncbi:YncE family protein [Nocardia concava]|uniref:YncE family protein n=1 Tax=Nocardia concava TaxID=257281 RepID=UPI00030DDDBC|nr:YncE family protein [Nocardia concava]
MNQPRYAAQPLGSAYGALTASVVADAGSALRLSRAMALARWRSPAGLGFMAAIPLILMSRRIFEVVSAASRSDTWILDLVGVYFGLLAVTIVMGVLLTAVALLRRNRGVVLYASPGATMTARYQRDSLELGLASGPIVIAYTDIKELFAIGGSVFLRWRGSRGLALPRELFPDTALQLMGRGLRSPAQRKRTVVIAAVTASVLVVSGAALCALSLLHSGGRSDAVALRKSIPADFTTTAVAVNANVAYVAGFDGKVRIVDLSTGTVNAVIPVGENPFGIAFDPATRSLYVANDPTVGHNGKITVIDTEAKVVRATIPFASGVWTLAIDPAMHRLYAIEVIPKSRNAVAVIDTGSNTVIGEIPVSTAAKDIVVDPRTHLVYVGSEDSEPIQVIDPASMKVTTTIPFGDRVRGLAVDPETHSLVAIGDEVHSTGDQPRILKIIDTVTNTVRGSTMLLAPMAWGVAVDPDFHKAYVVEQDVSRPIDDPKRNYESMRVVDTRSGAVTSSVTIASGKDTEAEEGLAVDPLSHRIVVADTRRLHVLSY